MLRRVGVHVLQVAIVVALLVVWEWGADTGRVNKFFTSSPSDIWATLRDLADDGSLWSNARATLSVVLVGWLLGVAIGAALGILLGISQNFAYVADAFVAFLNGIPRITFLPFFVIWLGYGTAPKVLLVAFVVWIIVATNVAVSLRSADGDLRGNVELLGAKTTDLWWHLHLPTVVGGVMGSARVTVGFAMQATVVSEMLGTNRGLGALVSVGQVRFDVSLVMAAIAVAVLLGIILDFALASIERFTDKLTQG